MAKEDKGQGGMTVREAGRRGGNKVKEKYGKEHFVKAGQKGGQAVAKLRGREFFVKIGSMGGKATKAKPVDEV
ncbi:MAG: general stress protein [Dehalococcoidia bacterium]|nr:general stress protein [Dehalococcoidia bacterium]